MSIQPTKILKNFSLPSGLFIIVVTVFFCIAPAMAQYNSSDAVSCGGTSGCYSCQITDMNPAGPETCTAPSQLSPGQCVQYCSFNSYNVEGQGLTACYNSAPYCQYSSGNENQCNEQVSGNFSSYVYTPCSSIPPSGSGPTPTPDPMAPDFVMNLTPSAPQTIYQTQSITYTLGLTPRNGYDSSVNLSCPAISGSASAAGIACQFSGGSSAMVPADPVQGDTILTFTLYTNNQTPPGTYIIDVNAADSYTGTPSHDVQATLTIDPNPACNTNLVGTNQFVGCQWSFPASSMYNSPAHPNGYPVGQGTLLGPAYALPQVPVPADDATSIPFTSLTSGINGWPNQGYAFRWKGTFTFTPGTYIFTYGSDDGMRAFWDDGNTNQAPGSTGGEGSIGGNGGTYIFSQWYDKAYGTQSTVSVPVTCPGTETTCTHQIDVEYFQDAGSAEFSLSWALQTPTTPITISAVSVTPSSGSSNPGSTVETFSQLYTDTAGSNDISQVWTQLLPPADPAPVQGQPSSGNRDSCYVRWDRGSNLMFVGTSVDSNNNIVWSSGSVMGSGSALVSQNSFCTLYPAQSSETDSGNNLTVKLAYSFGASFAGPHNFWMFANNNAIENSGWQNRGTWTVNPPAPTCVGQSGSVQLSFSTVSMNNSITASAPSGWSGLTFAPSNGSVSVSGNTGLSATVTGANTTPGSANINASGTAPNGAPGCSLTSTGVTVTDFSLSVSAPSPSSILGGNNATIGVTVNSINGGNMPVLVLPPTSGLPSGWSFNYPTGQIANAGSPIPVTFTLYTTAAATPETNYPLTFTGSYNSDSHNASTNITVTAPPGPPSGGNPSQIPASPDSQGACPNNGINISWTAGSPAPNGYNVYVNTVNASSTSNLLNSLPLPKTQTSYDDAPLSGGPYYFWVASVAGNGQVGALIGANTNASGGISPLSCNPTLPTGPQGANSGTSGSVACSFLQLSWVNQASNETAFYVYQNTINSTGTAIKIGTVNTMTPAGMTVTYAFQPTPSGTPYYYWVVAHNGFGDSTYLAFGQFADTQCAGNLANSNKNIVADNGSTFNFTESSPPHGATAKPCIGETDPLPPNIALNLNDVLTFQINLCNWQGTAIASNITLTDNMINLKMPSDASNFNAAYNGNALVYDGQAHGNNCDPSGSGHYCSYGTVPDQVLVFNLTNSSDNIAIGDSAVLSYQAQLAVPADFNGQTAHFQNSFLINYAPNLTATGFTPLLPFYLGNGAPSINEVP